MEEVSADQTTLRLVQRGVRHQRLFHVSGARLEDLEKIAMTPVEVFQNFGQMMHRNACLKAKHPVDDVVGSGLVRGVEISWFCRRLKRSDDDPGRIWPEI